MSEDHSHESQVEEALWSIVDVLDQILGEIKNYKHEGDKEA
jgi:hypothetical protein